MLARKTSFLLASTLQFANHETRAARQEGPASPRRGGPDRPPETGRGPGNEDHATQEMSSGVPTPNQSKTRATRQWPLLHRKEVIQPHLPVRLPCYDLVPITSPTFDRSPQKDGPRASGVADFHDLTGGVYKARERIHRGVADPRLLATPPSRSRVAGSDPN